MSSLQEILKNIPDKRKVKGTTSLVQKKDLYHFFNKNKFKGTIIELGTHLGYTTRFLSFVFDKVITIDVKQDISDKAKKFNRDRKNIEYVVGDAYENKWWETDKDIDAIFIDTVHDYEHICMDIENCLKLKGEQYLIFDDYGLFPEVKKGIDEYIKSSKLQFIQFIGENKGSDCRQGKVLKDREGIICKKV